MKKKANESKETEQIKNGVKTRFSYRKRILCMEFLCQDWRHQKDVDDDDSFSVQKNACK
jgi:hypothetical protein